MTWTRAGPTSASTCDARVAVRAEQQQRRELVIEPSAVAGQHEDALGAHRGGDVERELEIGGVLLVRMSLHARAGGLRHRDGFRRGGVEVAHRDRHLEAERERVLEPLVRRDDGCAERRSQRRTRVRRLSARYHHHDLFRHAFLRWHYPDQVLRVGGASVRPLSPAARAPRYVSGHRSDSALLDGLPRLDRLVTTHHVELR